MLLLHPVPFSMRVSQSHKRRDERMREKERIVLTCLLAGVSENVC
jgi:hypothetical protein